MAKIINLTPHAVVLRDAQGEETTISASGVVARVTTVPGIPEKVDGISVPVYSRDEYGSITGLPEPQGDTIYVVSLLVAVALNGARFDVVRPGTGPNDEAIRDEGGRIVAVTRLIRS